jgi:hypothetical protein
MESTMSAQLTHSFLCFNLPQCCLSELSSAIDEVILLPLAVPGGTACREVVHTILKPLVTTLCATFLFSSEFHCCTPFFLVGAIDRLTYLILYRLPESELR